MSHRKSDLGIPRPRKSAKVVLGSRLIKSTIQERRRDKQRRDSCAPVYRTRGDSHEVLEPVEGALDAPAKFVQTLAEAEWLFPIAAVRDHRLGSLLIQFLAQFGTVVGFVAEHALGGLHHAASRRRRGPLPAAHFTDQGAPGRPHQACWSYREHGTNIVACVAPSLLRISICVRRPPPRWTRPYPTKQCRG
jgi:hypothetical protein